MINHTKLIIQAIWITYFFSLSFIYDDDDDDDDDDDELFLWYGWPRKDV